MYTFEYTTRKFTEIYDFTKPVTEPDHHHTAEQLFEAEASVLGAQGWQLVAINAIHGGSSFSAIFMKTIIPAFSPFNFQFNPPAAGPEWSAVPPVSVKEVTVGDQVPADPGFVHSEPTKVVT